MWITRKRITTITRICSVGAVPSQVHVCVPCRRPSNWLTKFQSTAPDIRHHRRPQRKGSLASGSSSRTSVTPLGDTTSRQRRRRKPILLVTNQTENTKYVIKVPDGNYPFQGVWPDENETTKNKKKESATF